MPDAPQDLLNLLSTNWASSNTDSVVPLFAKITDKKKHDFNKARNVVFALRPRKIQTPAGIGTAQKNLVYVVDLDIRVFGYDQEAHFLKVITEVDRILDANINWLSTNYDHIDPDTEGQDLSNQMHDIWRFLKPVKLINYVVTR